MIQRTAYDDLQRQTETIEVCGTDAERLQRYRWHASGQMELLILENPDTGEQVTTWTFGSTLTDSEIARNDIIVAKQWPTGESGTFTVNRQGETVPVSRPAFGVTAFLEIVGIQTGFAKKIPFSPCRRRH